MPGLAERFAQRFRKAYFGTPLLNRDKPPEPVGLLFADVLTDFFVELRFGLPWPVFLELPNHARTGAWNA